MNSVETIRSIFKRIAEIQQELREKDYPLYEQFRNQNADLSDLEHYNLRRLIKNEDYEPIDTLEMRKALVSKWEGELKRLNGVNESLNE